MYAGKCFGFTNVLKREGHSALLKQIHLSRALRVDDKLMQWQDSFKRPHIHNDHYYHYYNVRWTTKIIQFKVAFNFHHNAIRYREDPRTQSV